MTNAGYISSETAEEFNDKKDHSLTAEENWSELPHLLLWMIMEHLDFVDNLRLAAVCHNWSFAFANCPKKLQSAGDTLPWVMYPRNSERSKLVFISVSKKEKYTIKLPNFFNGTKSIYSKQGWLLLQRRNGLRWFKDSLQRIKAERLPDSVFLYNPFTKTELEMPDIVKPKDPYAGSFSTFDGYPHYVVLLEYNDPTQITLQIAKPGDKAWVKYSYNGQSMPYSGFGGLHVLGVHVYCFSATGGMIIFNMRDQTWTELPDLASRFELSYMGEHEGEVVILQVRNLSSFRFFRLNNAQNAWEELNINEVKNLNWFLGRYTCFSAKSFGMKIYHLYGELEPNDRLFYLNDQSCGVDVIDMMDGNTQNLIPYVLPSTATWVHMA
nr:TPA_asm: hypothetical protein HUJ06_026403 [Nelumbo nucifera]